MYNSDGIELVFEIIKSTVGTSNMMQLKRTCTHTIRTRVCDKRYRAAGVAYAYVPGYTIILYIEII